MDPSLKKASDDGNLTPSMLIAWGWRPVGTNSSGQVEYDYHNGNKILFNPVNGQGDWINSGGGSQQISINMHSSSTSDSPSVTTSPGNAPAGSVSSPPNAVSHSGTSGATATTSPGSSDEGPLHVSSPFGQLTLQGQDTKGDEIFSNTKGQGEVINPQGKSTLYSDMTINNGVVGGTVYSPPGAGNAGGIDRSAGFGGDGNNAGTSSDTKTTEPKMADGSPKNDHRTSAPTLVTSNGVGSESTASPSASTGESPSRHSSLDGSGVGNESAVHSGHGEGGPPLVDKPTVLPAYIGGADIASIKGLKNHDLLTTTVTGAEVETTPTGSYTVKAAPPTASDLYRVSEAKSNEQAGIPTPTESAIANRAEAKFDDAMSSFPSAPTHPATPPPPIVNNITPSDIPGRSAPPITPELPSATEAALTAATHLSNISNIKANDVMPPPVVNPPITLPPTTPSDTPSPGLGSLNPSGVADPNSTPLPRHFGAQID